MNTYHVHEDHQGIGLDAPWGWYIESSYFNGNDTSITLIVGYNGDTDTEVVMVAGNPSNLEDAVKNIGEYLTSTGPIHGGGFPPIKK
jgi:hypothetical protein